jgi:protein gp37
MTVLKSHISWCDGTLNLSTGCTKVSAACDHCYAETLVNRLMGGGFETVRLHPDRVRDIRKFKPVFDTGKGEIVPKTVFVNSMSDFWHEQIDDAFIHRGLDAFEANPDIVFQILTKRPARMRQMVVTRYGSRGVPQHIWLGVSCEDNRVAARLKFLRRLKEQVGDFCAFTSVEPILAPCDGLDLAGIDWVLTGGESGPKCRPMQLAWLRQAHEATRRAGAALHFKQFGHPRNNPVVQALMREERLSITGAFAAAVARGLELAPHEKGGATYQGRVIQEKPKHWHTLKDSLNAGRQKALPL